MNKITYCILSIFLIIVVGFQLSGCATGVSNKRWVNYQYQRGTTEYKVALSSARKRCGNFAFKEGITIDGVTYYDQDSA